MAGRPLVNTFLERTRGARKIIVVDFGFLGDSIHLLPALWEIKRHYLEAELHTLSAPLGAELLQLAPCVDRAWAFPLGADSPGWWRQWQLLRPLRRERFDLAFNFSGADRTIFVAQYIGARHTLAHEANRRHFWNHWLAAEWVARVPSDRPMFEMRRRVLAAAGFPLAEPRFDLRVPAADQQWAQAAAPGDTVHFSINASLPVKEWPLENWAEFTRLLTARIPALRIVATAGPRRREVARLRELSGAVGGRVQIFQGLGVARLAALLQRCRLQIGGDSGVLHLALALGRPTLTVFRRYANLAEWMPSGPQHRSLIVDCGCITEGRSDCQKAQRAACLARIDPAALCDIACQQLL